MGRREGWDPYDAFAGLRRVRLRLHRAAGDHHAGGRQLPQSRPSQRRLPRHVLPRRGYLFEGS